MRLDSDTAKDIARRMIAAGSGRAVAAVVREIATTHRCSAQTVYDAAKRHGWTSGRARRSDRGRINKDVTVEQIEAYARLVLATHTEKGRVPMTGHVALKVLIDSGVIRPEQNVSVAYLNDQLKKRKISKRHATARTPHTPLMAEYPNQTHIIDCSQCAQWYIDRRGSVEHQQRDFEVYDNKEGNPNKITRYLLTDKYSGAFVVWYSDQPENTPTLIDFLLFIAWAPKSIAASRVAGHLKLSPEDMKARYPFRGMPELIYRDRGSALCSTTTQALLTNLGIRYMDHLPGNPRAKGANETMQRHWECAFEATLKVKPARSLEELNARALAFCAWYNAERPLTRAGRPRFDCWLRDLVEMKIPVREIPDPEFIYSIALSPEEVRKVEYDRTISYKPKGIRLPEGFSGKYRIPCADVVGDHVSVRFSVFEFPKVVIRSAKLGQQWICEPLAKDRVGQYPEISAILGKTYKSTEYTSAEVALAELNAHAPTPADRERRKQARPRGTHNAPAVPLNLNVSFEPPVLNGPQPDSTEFVPHKHQVSEPFRCGEDEARALVLTELRCRSQYDLTPAQREAFNQITGTVPRHEIGQLAAHIAALAPQAPLFSTGG